MFIWVLYLDNLPHYRFGAVKQQLWMILHLPLHLSILGVVEGTQHIALARYIDYSAEKFSSFVYKGCVRNHLDSPKLAKNLTDAVGFFKISYSAKRAMSLLFVYDQFYLLGNQSGVCSPKNTSHTANEMSGIPESFGQLFVTMTGSDVPSLRHRYSRRRQGARPEYRHTVLESRLYVLLGRHSTLAYMPYGIGRARQPQDCFLSEV